MDFSKCGLRFKICGTMHSFLIPAQIWPAQPATGVVGAARGVYTTDGIL